ncbi:MAG: hypothetical protein N3G18_07550 [Candidatus Saccharicenans sp.]|nr:hypothetical protein [Candidatus Saccharicenans sp.]
MNRKNNSQARNPVADLENFYNQTLSSLSIAADELEKVRLITEFFQSTRDLPEDLTRSFHLQLAGLFFFLTASFQPDGLPPEELQGYLEASWYLYRRFQDKILPDQLKETLSNLLFYLALSHFYLGELEDGLKILRKKQKLGAVTSPDNLESNLESTQAELPDNIRELKDQGSSNWLIFLELAKKVGREDGLTLDIDLIQDKWKRFTGWSSDSLFCPLVEKRGLLQAGERARLLLLESRCRRTGAAEGHNLVRFSNLPAYHQEKTYLMAADALEAADYLLKTEYQFNLPPCTLLFSFSEKNFMYSGESLSLPLATLSLTQKLISSQCRFYFIYSREAAFTGKIDLNGETQRISSEALEQKVRAAFYSGIRYLVIPAENLKEARSFVFNLLAKHPWRRLELIGIHNIREINADNRICQRIKLPLIAHLVRTRGPLIRRGLLGLIGLFAIITALVIINKNPSFHFWKIRHPVIIEPRDNRLFARNPEEQLLWTFPLRRPLKPESFQQKFVDLDGDEEEEILVSGEYLGEEKESAELFCLKKSGKLLWSYRPGRKIKTLTDEFSNHYSIKRFEVANFSNASPEKSVLVIGNHVTWYPTQIAMLNVRGQVLGEYWHAGHLGQAALLIEDLDEDGWQEIIIGGTNNDFQQACLLVLDSRAIAGCSPGSGKPEFQFGELPAGSQEYYLLLPRTTINQVMGLRNYVTSVQLFREEKTLEVITNEFNKEAPCQMMYNFDFKFNPLLSRPTDLLTEAVKELVVSRVLPPHSETELRSLKERIRYWDGEAWVNYPARNKKLNF